MTRPTGAAERNPSLDALRAVALLGVLLVNLLTIFRVSVFAQFVPGAVPPGTGADAIVERILVVGLESKPFVLFSFLFGVGLAAQRERGTRIFRRLGFLLALGLAHLFLLWNGDVLTLYALLGFCAVPLLRLSSRVLLALALVFFVVHLLPLPYPTPFPSFDALRHHVSDARIYRYGTFAEVLAFRIHEVRPISALLLWSAPRSLALFFLGACAWREGIFRGALRRLVHMVAVLGIASGLLLTIRPIDLRTWSDLASRCGAILLALGYGALLVVVLDPPSRVRTALAPLGRMALTTYLTQSIVLGAIFHGWGLGLYGRLGQADAAVMGVGLYAVQMVFAALWLARFRHGPVEWLWRSFTYGAWQPMRASASASA